MFDVGDLRICVDDGPSVLREVEVVLVERVLRVVVASDHAGADQRAAGATGTRAAEVGVVHLDTRLTEVHRHGGWAERVLDVEALGYGPHHVVRGCVRRRLNDAEHALREGVERGKFPLPVGDGAPLRVCVEGVMRFVVGVRVDERTTSDPRSGEHQHVAEEIEPLDTVEAEAGPPEEALEIPVGLGELPGSVAATRFQHTDAVALLGQSQRRDAAPKP